MQDPQPDFRPTPGVAEQLGHNLRRILAPNPSPMTFRGTNTYLIGQSDVAVIDPGPASEDHLAAILDAVSPGQRISHILVTHAHIDHAPLARPLAEHTGAPIYAFGPAEAGRSPTMQAIAGQGALGGGEGVDSAFEPDEILTDGARLSGPDWEIEALHTPGHMANHLSFACGEILFSGDLVMSWATSLVSPPDGDLTAFMASLRRLQARPWRVFHAGHGAPVTEPSERLAALIAHRTARGTAILEALRDGPATAADLAARIYTDTPAALLPAATRNVLAHLIDFTETSVVGHMGTLTAESKFCMNDGAATKTQKM